MNYRPK